MRVIAGSAKGRRLRAPSGLDVRPTSDRVREAVFSSVAHVVDLDGARVLDLFAGSGAMGIEALSRGAGHATFVDRDRAAVAAIDANLLSAGLGDRATVVKADVLDWLGRELDRTRDPSLFDLAIVDPPYAFDEWNRVLSALPASAAVLESDRELEGDERLRVVRVKRYGGTVVTLAVAAT